MQQSRQLAGLVVGNPEGEAPLGEKRHHYREDGEDNPFRDVTRMTGDETEIGDTRFDNPGPDLYKEGRMPIEHTSADA